MCIKKKRFNIFSLAVFKFLASVQKSCHSYRNNRDLSSFPHSLKTAAKLGSTSCPYVMLQHGQAKRLKHDFGWQVLVLVQALETVRTECHHP